VMKVLYDGDSLDNLGSGAGRYFKYLIEGILNADDAVLFDTRDRWDFVSSQVRRFGNERRSITRRILNRFGSIPRNVNGVDVSHTTFFRKVARLSCPEVITVYDMIAESYPEFCRPWGTRQIEEKAEAICRADACVAISHETAKKMAILYPDSVKKTFVIHLGCEHVDDWVIHGEKARGVQRYVLYVGSRVGYKNFRAVAAATACSAWPSNVELRVAGSPFTPDEELMLRRDRISSIGLVSDSELATQYQSSLAVIFPSLDEGFGLPIVEAQRLGVPVLCSDIPIFNEIAVSSAVYFPPREPSKIADIVANVEGSESLREQLIAAGKQNVKRFSWQSCVAETRRVYASLCK
jgi:glycosyltransferase involved in cell wall biosynthesis